MIHHDQVPAISAQILKSARLPVDRAQDAQNYAVKGDPVFAKRHQNTRNRSTYGSERYDELYDGQKKDRDEPEDRIYRETREHDNAAQLA